MRKPKKTTVKRKLDKLVSEVVRSQGFCSRCRNQEYDKLQACHIYSRMNMAVRWDTDNVLCLCAGCHFWAHQNPVLFGEWVKTYLGIQKYNKLKLRASMIKKWTIEEFLILVDDFKRIKEAKPEDLF